MPPKSKQSGSNICHHTALSYTSSPHASQTKYQQPTKQERLAAAKPKASRLPIPPTRSDIHNFPAPLVLPDDDLAVDPDPPQDFQRWLGVRNQVTSRRRTIYVAAPPVTEGMDMKEWTAPHGFGTSGQKRQLQVPKPKVADVVDYIAAFYHGLPVRELQLQSGFTPWADDRSKVGLQTHNKCIQIRSRPSLDGVYSCQLNLTDLLDAAMAMLPSDAYALCLLVDYDLYEADDDLFVCGRAYGGRRVAVISTARYNPLLDAVHGIDSDHVWPASHCRDFVESTCREQGSATKRPRKDLSPSNVHHEALGRPNSQPPLSAAVTAFTNLLSKHNSTHQTSTLWLFRVLRTITHELGHCFGIGHCAYYACLMQGSASLAEDMRQPPYLCPVDLAKVLSSTRGEAAERYKALLGFCQRDEAVRQSPHFGAFAAWLRCEIGDEST